MDVLREVFDRSAVGHGVRDAHRAQELAECVAVADAAFVPQVHDCRHGDFAAAAAMALGRQLVRHRFQDQADQKIVERDAERARLGAQRDCRRCGQRHEIESVRAVAMTAIAGAHAAAAIGDEARQRG
jgi:hypothetical protein